MALGVKRGLDLRRTRIDVMYHRSWMPEEAAVCVHGISPVTVCYFSSIKEDLCEFTCALLAKQIETFRLP